MEKNIENIIAIERINIKNWWGFLIMGILYIAFGIWLLYTPVESFEALAVLFSFLMLISGIIEISFSLINRKEYKGWLWYLAGGVLDLLIGIVLISNPKLSMEILPFIVGFWVMFRGILAVGVGLGIKSFGIREKSALLLTGVAMVLFAFMMFINPIAGDLAIVVLTALSFISTGIFRIYIAVKFKNIHKQIS